MRHRQQLWAPGYLRHQRCGRSERTCDGDVAEARRSLAPMSQGCWDRRRCCCVERSVSYGQCAPLFGFRRRGEVGLAPAKKTLAFDRAQQDERQRMLR